MQVRQSSRKFRSVNCQDMHTPRYFFIRQERHSLAPKPPGQVQPSMEGTRVTKLFAAFAAFSAHHQRRRFLVVSWWKSGESGEQLCHRGGRGYHGTSLWEWVPTCHNRERYPPHKGVPSALPPSRYSFFCSSTNTVPMPNHCFRVTPEVSTARFYDVRAAQVWTNGGRSARIKRFALAGGQGCEMSCALSRNNKEDNMNNWRTKNKEGHYLLCALFLRV